MSKAEVRHTMVEVDEDYGMHEVSWVSENFIEIVLYYKFKGKYSPDMVILSPPRRFRFVFGCAPETEHWTV